MSIKDEILNNEQKSTAVTKIAFFLPGLRTGGAEHVMAFVASAVADRGFAVDFVLVKA